MPLFYPFPSAPVSASTAAGSSILTFNGAAPFAVVPPWVTVGTFVVADGSPGAIPPGTKVQSVPSNTTVNMSNNVNGGKTIQTGKPITFVTFPVLTLVTTAASATGTLTFHRFQIALLTEWEWWISRTLLQSHATPQLVVKRRPQSVLRTPLLRLPTAT